MPRSTYNYSSRRDPQEYLRRRLRELALIHVAYGYRRLHILLRREGWPVGISRVYRLYTEENLTMKRKRPKRRRSVALRKSRPAATLRDQRWSMDFMADQLYDGRRFRCLTLVDHFTRESPAIEVGASLTGKDVVRVLERLSALGRRPESITVDNGSEFVSKALDLWAYTNGVTLDFIRPGKPVENAAIESFNSLVRKECLNLHWFQTLEEARARIENWRIEYNRERPHGSLDDQSPQEFLRALVTEPAVATAARLTE
jgi:putative transposase